MYIHPLSLQAGAEVLHTCLPVMQDMISPNGSNYLSVGGVARGLWLYDE